MVSSDYVDREGDYSIKIKNTSEYYYILINRANPGMSTERGNIKGVIASYRLYNMRI